MNPYSDLINKLKNLLHDDALIPLTREEAALGVRFLQLRDALLTIGDVLEEDENNEIYLASVKVGFGKLNRVYIAARIKNDVLYVAAYAKEGFIKQNMAEKVTCHLVELLEKKSEDHSDNRQSEKEPVQKKHGWKFYAILGIAAVFLLASIISFIVAVPFSKATKEYNTAISQYNVAAKAYNQQSAAAFLSNLDGFDDEALILSPAQTDFDSLLKSFFGGNSIKKIHSDIETLQTATQTIKSDTAAIKRIVSPDASVVADRIKKIEKVSAVGCASADNDPGQLLNKDGGYVGCVYFSLSDITSKNVKGKTPVERGTDGGGAIEIFANKEDALKRCEYLAQLKDSLLYSGSYAAVGTLVIRASYLLDDEQQYDVTSAVVNALIAEA